LEARVVICLLLVPFSASNDPDLCPLTFQQTHMDYLNWRSAIPTSLNILFYCKIICI